MHFRYLPLIQPSSPDHGHVRYLTLAVLKYINNNHARLTNLSGLSAKFYSRFKDEFGHGSLHFK